VELEILHSLELWRNCGGGDMLDLGDYVVEVDCGVVVVATPWRQLPPRPTPLPRRRIELFSPVFSKSYNFPFFLKSFHFVSLPKK